MNLQEVENWRADYNSKVKHGDHTDRFCVMLSYYIFVCVRLPIRWKTDFISFLPALLHVFILLLWHLLMKNGSTDRSNYN